MESIGKPMVIRTETRESYDPISDTSSNEVILCISPEQIREGIISKLVPAGDTGNKNGSRNFVVLVTIASHMSKDGKSFPSLTRIAELTGMSRQTVSKAIDELVQIEFNGKKVLRKTQVPSVKGHKKTIYHFNEIEQEIEKELETAKLTTEVDSSEIGTEALTSKTALMLFMYEYEKAFGIPYVPNYGKDMSQIKSKLIGKFEDDDLRAGITVAVSQYEKNWKNPRYPYPSVGMLTSWLMNEAMKVVKTDKEKDQEFESRVAEAEKIEDLNPLELLG